VLIQSFLRLQARPYLNLGNIKQLVDRRLDGTFDAVQMNRMVLTAGLCVRRSAPWRPSMSQVWITCRIPPSMSFLVSATLMCPINVCYETYIWVKFLQSTNIFTDYIFL